MTEKKIPWQAPVVKSIDQISAVFGKCSVGTTPVAGGPNQCNAGTGAASGNCSRGNGASILCSVGKGR
jgi:hypothetical protein